MSKRLSALPQIGVVGLGLMGRGISTCLLINGYTVTGYDHAHLQGAAASAHIREAVEKLIQRKLLSRKSADAARKRFHVVRSLRQLAQCGMVIEAIREDMEEKRKLIQQLEGVLSEDAVIASNTSSFPITQLQDGAKLAGRVIGVHWPEPAEITTYLEIIPGQRTLPETIQRARQLAAQCHKDPAFLNFDIRGFLSNRMMYAIIREACFLVESGVADVETVDRAFRGDIGWWATLAGPFRWMDLTGIPTYAAVMEGLLPELSSQQAVPKLMKDIVSRGAKGISNSSGFYSYSKASAKQWERAWVDFTYDIRRLEEKYNRRMNSRRGH